MASEVRIAAVKSLEQRKQWDDLASRPHVGHMNQCLWWAGPLRRYGIHAHVLGCWVGDELVGGALFRSFPVPLTKSSITQCLNGPIFLTWNSGWADEFVAHLMDLGRESNSITVSIEACPDQHVHHDIVAAMHRAGLRTALSPGNTEAVLPLTARPRDELWKQFSDNTKRNIKKGNNRVNVRRITSLDDLGRAYGAWMVTARRKAFNDVRPWIALEPLLRYCTDSGLGSVLASFVEEQLLASVFVTHIGETSVFVYGGFVDGSESYSPNHVLHYEAIRECLERGTLEYNFGRVFLRPNEVQPDGVGRFKMAFGCKLRKNLETITWERRPHLNDCMRWVRGGRIGKRLEALFKRHLIRRGQP